MFLSVLMITMRMYHKSIVLLLWIHKNHRSNNEADAKLLLDPDKECNK